MASVTWTQDDIDTLKAAVASGIVTVSYSGPPARTVTYQNITEMKTTLAKILAEMGNADGTRTGYRFAATRKGV